MHQSAEENNKVDISACCSNCRDRSLWGRIFFDFNQRFLKFSFQCRLPCKLMSCRRLFYYKICGLMFWLIVIKCKWPASFQYFIFHIILSFLKNSNLLLVLYITFRINGFNEIKELLEMASQYLKTVYFIRLSLFICLYMINIETYTHVHLYTCIHITVILLNNILKKDKFLKFL